MSPTGHLDVAIQLLADALYTEDPSEACVLTQGAIARALLALVEIEIAKSAPGDLSDVIRGMFGQPPQGDRT